MPQITEKLGILVASGVRGLMYLDAFDQNGLAPGGVIVHGTPSIPEIECKGFWEKFGSYYQPQRDLDYYIRKWECDVEFIDNPDVNSDELFDSVRSADQDIFIYSGGGIVKPRLLETGKRLIHMHPGNLPFYRGSTCFYYSMLEEGTCSVTAFFMESRLDEGDTIVKRFFRPPTLKRADWRFFDLLYDPWIRSQTLSDLLKTYRRSLELPRVEQDLDLGRSFFVIHPVLKHLAMNAYLED